MSPAMQGQVERTKNKKIARVLKRFVSNLPGFHFNNHFPTQALAPIRRSS